jgi:hypothetical protein
VAVNRDSRPESAPGIEKQRSHRQKVLSEHQNASTADVLTRDWGILQEVLVSGYFPKKSYNLRVNSKMRTALSGTI